MDNKLDKLKRILKECGRVTVAFSSGVDSTFLLKVARETLPRENVIAITISSAFTKRNELSEAIEFCNKNDIYHEIVDVDILSVPEIKMNPDNRCYICKKRIFEQIIKRSKGYVVCEGSNVDDMSDYRPGMQAIKELEVRSPLREAGLTKDEIRKLSRQMNLPTWDKPSAACLASRLAYGEEITIQKLKCVDRAEDRLLKYGFRQFRVRVHGEGDNLIARIELTPEDMKKAFADDSIREEISDSIKKEGFRFVTIDLSGYRMGSMNEMLNSNNTVWKDLKEQTLL